MPWHALIAQPSDVAGALRALYDTNDCLLIVGDGAALGWMLRIAAGEETVPQMADRLHEATICLVAGVCVLMNGDMAGAHPAAIDTVAAARARGVPIYALAPNGPTAAALTGTHLLASLLNAIITDRGVYRPERIATYRHLPA